ncbi:DUF2652 domain-containing protein [Microbacterium gallinarum]|jgi:hypothetical protein|uniref:DUF2652 domain-containing protein n=1 Tax=Microbacterium gallinarum TaxID=2762209 RepID=A0ABR8X7U5_9MICO|nr:DUF2652 domain-containing protein [Microbacterium gallinarum]MBD8024986.1 DUF2652 domain-containing protein [Microbacterium gallinarum]
MTSARAALLIADIGGYTAYMSSHRMTLAHAEVNTARMLDRMIGAAPGFDLVEIEGDAAFLSRKVDARDPDTTVTDVLRTAAAMHRAFHVERHYVAKNLCPCGGCKQVGELKLKFVAHVGEVATQTIRGRDKLVGIDVILVHRLLKNSVPIPEYVLLSEDLYLTDAGALPDSLGEITPDLEGIGTVRAYFADVAQLDGELPPLPDPSWRGRLGSTLTAVREGLPYMLGRKKPRLQR